MKIKATVTGGPQAQAVLNELNQSIVRKRCRKAMTKALSPAVKAAKGKAPRKTGQMKKSVGKKVKVYQNRSVVGLVGVRTGFKIQVGVRKSGRNAGKAIFHDPAKVAHIVEIDRPWLRPAWDASKGEVEKIFGTELGADLEKTK